MPESKDKTHTLQRFAIPVRNHVAAKVPFEDVDDVTQAALFQIARDFSRFDAEQAGFSTWAAKITDQVIGKHYRAAARRPPYVSDTFAFTPDADDGTDEQAQSAEARFGEGEAPEAETPPPTYRPAPSVAWLPRAAYVFVDDDADAAGVEAVAPISDEPEERATADQTRAHLAGALAMLDPDEPGITQNARDLRAFKRRKAARAALNNPNVHVKGWTRHGMAIAAAWNHGATPAHLFDTLELLLTVDVRISHALIKAYAKDSKAVAAAFGFHANAPALRRAVLQAIDVVKSHRRAA